MCKRIYFDVWVGGRLLGSWSKLPGHNANMSEPMQKYYFSTGSIMAKQLSMASKRGIIREKAFFTCNTLFMYALRSQLEVSQVTVGNVRSFLHSQQILFHILV